MSEQPHPPAEPAPSPPITPGPMRVPASEQSGLENYTRVAETVGMMPSFRKFDYIFQGACVVIGALAGAGIGYIFLQGLGALFGALAGFIVMGVFSGMILMVLGWVRAFKK